ncbi:hypothetical protein ACI789_22180 [Geodermatophilus sp. SYSU D00965]
MTDDREDRAPGDGPVPHDAPAFVDDPGTADQARDDDPPAVDPDAFAADAPDTDTGKAQAEFDEDQPGPGV